MSSSKKNKVILYLGITVVVLIIVLISAKSAGWIGKNEGTRVSVGKVELKTIIESVSANGKIQPEVEVKISSDVSGEVKELYVKEGDSVIAGQLLAVIDPELYQSALDRAEAILSNSKANLASARARVIQNEVRFSEMQAQYERNKKLYDQKLISDAEFQTAKSAFAAAKADEESGKQNVIASEYTVKTQEAGIKEASKNLSRTRIYAPVSGTISKLSVEKGERVVGTSQMAGTEMMRLANLNNMEVSVDVNENDIVKVSIGDTCTIEVDSYNNRKFEGIVTEVANSATTSTAASSDQVTNFVVKIRILRQSYADLTESFGVQKSVFRPGMSASVEIQTETAHGVLAVPIESVTLKSKSLLDTTNVKAAKKTTPVAGKTNDDIEVVFVHQNGEVVLKQVKTGVQDDKYIQITEGLTARDEVVTGPYSAISRTLKQKDKVKVVEKSELFEAKDKSDK
ncbi:MAG: efflux RND transporter periplasmic adaptor subunit [Bacteroidia bacterium]|jgi:HlyD family secretion protein